MRAVLPLSILVLAGTAPVPTASADEVSAIRSKSMTSDPATNHALERYTRLLPDRAQETVRTVMLFRILSRSCLGSMSDKRSMEAYWKASGFKALKPEDAKAAARFGSAQFDALDYDDLAHLCAGSDYLFGPAGVLVRNAMTKGNGRLKFGYDPANPYVSVKPFLPE